MYGHHTQEQAKNAFLRAQKILEELTELHWLVSFQLHVDGSGVLWLGKKSTVTHELYTKAVQLVRSNRVRTDPVLPPKDTDYDIGIAFCCGLIDK
jgi:hypothetical protein